MPRPCRRPAGTAPALRLSSPRRPLRDLPPHALVVIGGLPGAGKTTLLRRLAVDRSVHALDAEDVAAALGRLPVPYRVLRPLVHGVHLVRVLRATASRAPCVLTTDPLTGRVRWRLLRTAARCSDRRLVVLLVAATPEQARDGQVRRGRVLAERRMARHEQRYRRRWERSAAAGADAVLTREQAATVGSLRDALRTGAPRDAPDPGQVARAVVR